MVEVPRRQLVQVSGELTAIPDLGAPPSPAIPAGPLCDRPNGCYSNQQLEGMLGTALRWGGKMADSLTTIRGLMTEALNPKPVEGEPP